jgi:outer membrane protein assembly factor BamB
MHTTTRSLVSLVCLTVLCSPSFNAQAGGGHAPTGAVSTKKAGPTASEPSQDKSAASQSASSSKSVSGAPHAIPSQGAGNPVLRVDQTNDAVRWAVKIDDFTAEARKMNTPPSKAPPKKFRDIEVSELALPKNALTKRGDGFEVKLPSGAPVTTPAVYKGTVYVSGGFRSKQFFAFSARDGKTAWGAALGDDGPSTPACEDGVCVFNTESCTVFALDAKTGRKKWARWLGDPQLSAPTIYQGTVFTSYPAHSSGSSKGADHVIAAFDLTGGKLLWQRWIVGDVMSAPVAQDGELLVSTFGGILYRFRPKDGTIISAERAGVTSAPLVVGGKVYYTQRTDSNGNAEEGVASSNRRGPAQKAVYAKKQAAYLDRNVQGKSHYDASGKSNDAANGFSSGAPASAKAGEASALVGQATVANLQAFQGSKMIHYRGLNFLSMGDEVLGLKPEDGKKVWSVKIAGDLGSSGGFLATPPAAAGGFLFVGTLSGNVLQIDATSGRLVRTYKVGHPIRSQPVVQNGWIYVGTENGRLVAINTNDSQLTGWAAWGGNSGRTGQNDAETAVATKQLRAQNEASSSLSVTAHHGLLASSGRLGVEMGFGTRARAR